jgi:hypothetical protein
MTEGTGEAVETGAPSSEQHFTSSESEAYQQLRNEADRMEALLKEELLRFALVHAEKAYQEIKTINTLDEGQRLGDEKVLKRVKRVRKVFRILRDLLTH